MTGVQTCALPIFPSATGRIERGKVKVGDNVEIVGIQETKKSVVTSIEMFRKLLDDGMPALEACLFKLAVEKGECWDFSKKRKRRLFTFYEEQEGDFLNIPAASYDLNMLKYFKVAVSSQFPSQSFLSYYHVLEYNFLSVSDESLQGKLIQSQ